MKAAARALVALVLGLVVPGWGHLYVGRARRSIIAFAIALILLGVIGFLSTFPRIAVALIALAALSMFVIVDPPVLALRKREVPGQWYRRWYMYFLWVFAYMGLLAVWTATRESYLGYNVFIMRSDAMAPTIANGDFIFVDTRAFSMRQPQVHDVVVGSDLQTQRPFIRRVTAVDSSGVSLRGDNSASPAAHVALTQNKGTRQVYSLVFGTGTNR